LEGRRGKPIVASKGLPNTGGTNPAEERDSLKQVGVAAGGLVQRVNTNITHHFVKKPGWGGKWKGGAKNSTEGGWMRNRKKKRGGRKNLKILGEGKRGQLQTACPPPQKPQTQKKLAPRGEGGPLKSNVGRGK